MARLGIVFGLCLCGLSAIGMVATVNKDPIQFIPLMLGIPILFCGVVALNPHRRRIAMNTATAIGAIGVLIGLIQAIVVGVRWSDGEPVSPVGWKLIVAMTWFSASLAIACIVASLRARRSKPASAADQRCDAPPPVTLPKTESIGHESTGSEPIGFKNSGDHRSDASDRSGSHRHVTR